MTSGNMKMKLLGCIYAYALFALICVSNGQNSSSEHPKTQHEPQGNNKTENESSTGQNLTVEPREFGNDTTGVTEVYDFGDITENSTLNVTQATTHNGTSEDDTSEADYSDLSMSDTAQTTTVLLLPETTETNGGSSWGYVILMLILLLVLALCIILFYMRRVSRTYSFELQRPTPARTNEPIGTFEPVHLDDLDYQIHTAGNVASADEANGTVLSNEEKEPKGEVEKEEPQTNGLQTPVPSESSPTEKTEPDQDQPDQDPENQDPENHADQPHQDHSPSPILFIEESEDETNVNNNNPMVRSSDPFVEINLDEPQQIFSSSSSVQPFSPSVFSSLS